MEKLNNSEFSEFLDKKYQDLAGSIPVERAVQKARKKGDSPHSREERIDTYLDRLENLFGQEGDEDERGFELIKHKVLSKYVTKPDEIPDSYWKLQENIMRDNGQLGDWNNANEEQKNEIKRQNSEGVLQDQEASLEQWVDYFHLKDSDYIPRELKYWIFRNIIRLQEFDKEKKEFPKRSKGTVKMFPDLNHEALAYVIDQIQKKYRGEKPEWEHDIQPEERQQFEQYLAKEDFAKLYAWANDLMNPIPEHLLPITEGEWRKFDKGTSEDELVQSIRGKGTGWCTAGKTTAHKQLQGGDFYVYYSLDDNGEAKIPRLAIRMENNKIAEVRGIAYKQNIDPYMIDVLDKKLDEFPDKEMYLKKKSDMEQLTTIDKKVKSGEPLTKLELEFLYEINSTIEGFGYQKDPRIEEIRNKRNIQEDASIIFECTKEEIAYGKNEVNENTKAYIGVLYPNIFKELPDNIEHIYTSFPEGRVLLKEIQLPTQEKTPQEYETEITGQGMKVGDWGRDILSKANLKEGLGEKIKIAIISNKSLGFPNGATRQESQDKAKELGIASKLLPPLIGPELRKQYTDQPIGEYILVDMESVLDRDGNPRVFFVLRNSDDTWLYANYGRSGSRWIGNSQWAFLAS